MLRSLETLRTFDVYNRDRRLGGVYDICFDCRSWEILYLALDTGRSLFREPLLISIKSSAVQIETSKKRIVVDAEPAEAQRRSIGWLQSSTFFDDPDYHRARELVPYCMRTTGRPTGHLEDVILDDETWTVRYLVMDTGTVAPRWAVRLDRSQHIGFLEPERPRARA